MRRTGFFFASNCDPLRWARSWLAALRAAFFSIKISILTVPSKTKDMTFGHVLRFENREKFNARGKWIAHLRAKSRRKRRLRSETRLRAQSAEVLPASKRLYGANAPTGLWPVRWAPRHWGNFKFSVLASFSFRKRRASKGCPPFCCIIYSKAEDRLRTAQ